MIAVDAMGGDHAPHVTVYGALNASRKGISVALYGDQEHITLILNAAEPAWKKLPLRIVHCSDMVSMDAIPTQAILRQQDTSLYRTLQAVVNGQAQVAVTAGNSGAALVAGMLIYKTIGGIDRPALGKYVPTNHGAVFCLDLGVNADCKPEYMLQFALMGHAYTQIDRNLVSPRIGLLSNGHEPYKGSTLVKKAYTLLHTAPHINFIGNIEARDIFQGHADVVISDGFTGNIMLKTAQGTAKMLINWVEQACHKRWLYKKLFSLFGNKIFSTLLAKTDYAHQSGALLLGLQYPLIVTHGCTTALGIERSIVYAHELAQRNFLTHFNNQLHGILTHPSLNQMSLEHFNQKTTTIQAN